MSQQTKVDIGINTRLSYANIWEPKSINGGKEKYSVSLIIPKSDQKTVTVIKKAIDAAIQEGIWKFCGKKPNKTLLSYHFAMEMLNVTMLLTKIVTSSTPIRLMHHRLWISTFNQFSIATKSTVTVTLGFLLTFMLLTPMATIQAIQST